MGQNKVLTVILFSPFLYLILKNRSIFYTSPFPLVLQPTYPSPSLYAGFSIRRKREFASGNHLFNSRRHLLRIHISRTDSIVKALMLYVVTTGLLVV